LIWYIFPVWVSRTKKNLATLLNIPVNFSFHQSYPEKNPFIVEKSVKVGKILAESLTFP
jgi:hypothetical protein